MRPVLRAPLFDKQANPRLARHVAIVHVTRLAVLPDHPIPRDAEFVSAVRGMASGR